MFGFKISDFRFDYVDFGSAGRFEQMPAFGIKFLL